MSAFVRARLCGSVGGGGVELDNDFGVDEKLALEASRGVLGKRGRFTKRPVGSRCGNIGVFGEHAPLKIAHLLRFSV